MSDIENQIPPSKPAGGKGAGKKNSTSEVPMVGLRDVLEFIKTIHSNGLERASMPDVAKGTGYGNASSTPFYRRLSASRHFGLLSSRGADLTLLGQDCVKPMADDATHRALVEAVQNVPSYAELITSHDGKRLNTKILANWFERKFEVNESAASYCAKAFVESMHEAGGLSADQVLNFKSPTTSRHVEPEPSSTQKENAANQIVTAPQPEVDGHRFELILNHVSKRRLVIFSPASVTAAELKRIQDWLSFQLLIVEQDTTGHQQ